MQPVFSHAAGGGVEPCMKTCSTRRFPCTCERGKGQTVAFAYSYLMALPVCVCGCSLYAFCSDGVAVCYYTSVREGMMGQLEREGRQ